MYKSSNTGPIRFQHKLKSHRDSLTKQLKEPTSVGKIIRQINNHHDTSSSLVESRKTFVNHLQNANPEKNKKT